MQESVSQVTDGHLWQQRRVPQHQRSASFPSVSFTRASAPRRGRARLTGTLGTAPHGRKERWQQWLLHSGSRSAVPMAASPSSHCAHTSPRTRALRRSCHVLITLLVIANGIVKATQRWHNREFFIINNSCQQNSYQHPTVSFSDKKLRADSLWARRGGYPLASVSQGLVLLRGRKGHRQRQQPAAVDKIRARAQNETLLTYEEAKPAKKSKKKKIASTFIVPSVCPGPRQDGSMSPSSTATLTSPCTYCLEKGTGRVLVP